MHFMGDLNGISVSIGVSNVPAPLPLRVPRLLRTRPGSSTLPMAATGAGHWSAAASKSDRRGTRPVAFAESELARRKTPAASHCL